MKKYKEYELFTCVQFPVEKDVMGDGDHHLDYTSGIEYTAAIELSNITALAQTPTETDENFNPIKFSNEITTVEFGHGVSFTFVKMPLEQFSVLLNEYIEERMDCCNPEIPCQQKGNCCRKKEVNASV